MKEDSRRLFIGISLPQEIQEKLVFLEDELKKFILRGRWIKKESLHLTLKFLGYCDSDRVGQIDQKIKEVAQSKDVFTFTLQGLGAFPTLKRARVIWVGVGEGAGQFVDLAESIDSSLEELGFETENRPFHPHITLARLKIPSAIDETHLTKLADQLPQNELKAQSIILFQSKLTPSGAEYSKITENLLKTCFE